MATSAACQASSALSQVTIGCDLSTLNPAIGPAVAQLPTASHTSRVPLTALSSAVPFGTLVVRVKLAAAPSCRPEPSSLAAQLTVTSKACQAPSGLWHAITGALLSIFRPLSCAV